MNMKIYKTKSGIVVERDKEFYLIKDKNWDDFINCDNIREVLYNITEKLKPIKNAKELIEKGLLPPIGSQEIWAAGVTYYRSRDARMEESKNGGGDVFYDKVYAAERPELFLKATANRVVGHMQEVRIRKDSTWDVPEPELTLVITSSAKIIGYTIGNDMSSRSIEAENPLYLPQAKIYNKSAAIGPCILLTDKLDLAHTGISLEIERKSQNVFAGSTKLDQMKRRHEELVSFLFKETSFPPGVLLMTGTGIVPDNSFTLQSGDIVHITIDGIGTLTNFVE
jgi:2-dehydro-3-deoxy-D-arabinonate dehydratase